MKRLLILLAPLLLAATPGPSFDSTPPPPAPDYTHAETWAAHGTGTADTDVFYIQPTTFHGETWNQDLADKEAKTWVDASVTTRQLTAFAACCRLYQPRYRQASARAFGAIGGDGDKAYALAYSDVRRAFALFLRQTGNRPFILAGHSQGSLHALRLLEEEIAGKPAAKRLVAAYIPGLGIPLGLFGTTLRGLAPCATPTQTGCVASWNSYLPSADVTTYVTRSGARFPGDAAGRALLCTNPLTFDTSTPAAPATANRGALLGTPGVGPVPAPTPAAASAECAGGVLRVTPSASVTVTPLPGGSLHLYDIALFWANLRDNAAARAAAFHRNHR